jgi:hypothetical protein
MVLSGMSDVGLIAIMLAAFLLGIGLVRLLDRLISADAPADSWADEPPDANGTDLAGRTGASTDQGGTR